MAWLYLVLLSMKEQVHLDVVSNVYALVSFIYLICVYVRCRDHPADSIERLFRVPFAFLNLINVYPPVDMD
jgi:hypothetical protein